MAELKTKKTNASVSKFISDIGDEGRRKDAEKLVKIFESVTGEKARMWGASIVGFGSYHYKSERSSQQGEWMLTAFSPRKKAFSLYIMSGFKSHGELLNKLGKYEKSGGCCLYIKKLEDVDVSVLKKLIRDSIKEVREKHKS